MAICAQVDVSNQVFVTTDAIGDCDGYVLMDAADYAAHQFWTMGVQLFDPTTAGYWQLMAMVLGMMTLAFTFKELGRFIKRG